MKQSCTQLVLVRQKTHGHLLTLFTLNPNLVPNKKDNVHVEIYADGRKQIFEGYFTVTVICESCPDTRACSHCSDPAIA